MSLADFTKSVAGANPSLTPPAPSVPATGFMSAVADENKHLTPERQQKLAGINQDLRDANSQAFDQRLSVGNVLKVIKEGLPGIAPKSFDLRKGADIASQDQIKTYKDTVDRFENVKQVFSDHKSLLEKGVALGEAGMGAINSLFTAVTTPLKLISTVPVVGYAGDVVNNVFALIGQGGSIDAGVAVDHLPISEDSKATIRPLAQELGALAAQIIAGKAGEAKYTEFRDKSVNLVDKVIDETSKANPTEAIPRSGAPVPPQGAPSVLDPKVSSFDQAVRGENPDIKTPPPEGDPQVSRTSLKIQEEARARALTNEFPDVPFVDKMKLAEEAIKADELVKTNPDQAREVLNRPVVEVRDQSVFNALKRKALVEGDVPMIQELAKSKIGTEAAQNLKALDDGFRLDADPVEALKEVQVARATKAAKGTTVERAVAKEKATLPKVEKLKPADWGEFIDTLTC